MGVQIVTHANQIRQPSKPLSCGCDTSNARPSMFKSYNDKWNDNDNEFNEHDSF